VLENGPASLHAGTFDISWHPANRNLENKVLLPLLEDQYGTVLEAGKMHLAFEEGAFVIYYYDHRLPVSPDTYPLILQQPLDNLVATLGDENEQVREMRSIMTALSYLPPPTERAHERIVERSREKEVIKGRLARLAADSEPVTRAIDETVKEFNGKAGVAST